MKPFPRATVPLLRPFTPKEAELVRSLLVTGSLTQSAAALGLQYEATISRSKSAAAKRPGGPSERRATYISGGWATSPPAIVRGKRQHDVIIAKRNIPIGRIMPRK